MHATHHSSSPLLLVLERRRDGSDEEADYWFRLIRTFGGPDAPVVIVLNKQKLAPFDVNRGAWLEKYVGNIKAFVETDCADPKSIARLKELIQDQLNTLESLKTKFPTQWFAIKERLANMPADFISFADYRAVCRTNGEEDPESQELLSRFLHDLGVAFNYKNDPRLRFAYVLKPEWVTKGIYAIIHASAKAKGIFTHTEAEQVLIPQGYSLEAVDFLLGLMERFELSFPLTGPRQQILIPQLLDDQQPSAVGNFQPKECLNFGYRYAIVPEGLLPRFIVRTHHLSEPAGRWKSGVILRHAASDCRALVRADVADKQVRIHIDGPADGRRDLLAIVRYNFEVIHSDYGCQPDDLVYPPGVPERPLNLEDLLDLLPGDVPHDVPQWSVTPCQSLYQPASYCVLGTPAIPMERGAIAYVYACVERSPETSRSSLRDPLPDRMPELRAAARAARPDRLRCTSVGLFLMPMDPDVRCSARTTRRSRTRLRRIRSVGEDRQEKSYSGQFAGQPPPSNRSSANTPRR